MVIITGSFYGPKKHACEIPGSICMRVIAVEPHTYHCVVVNGVAYHLLL
jgi:hypothetical protein